MENQPTQNLLKRLIGLGLVGQVALGLLLLVPGTLRYWQGWAFMAVTAILTLTFCTYYYRRDRELLARRMLRKEKIGRQKVIMLLIREIAAVFYVVCGLDHRFGWSQTYIAPVPGWLAVLALLAYAGCHLLFIPVLNANRFAASIVQIETGQTVADTGPYRRVRHPMYAVGIVSWFLVPLALGSFVALPLTALIVPMLIWRLLNEEKWLRHDLHGYAEYCQRTRYRLIPFVW